MPKVEATRVVDVDVWTAFAVSQTTGEVRLRWDPFIRHQHHLNGAERAGVGVRSKTVSRHGLSMVSQYVSFVPPRRVGMKMLGGPWFFSRFGGGWVFKPLDATHTEATWRYTFDIKPSILRPIAVPIGNWLLGRDIEARLAGFARGCRDEVVLAAAAELVEVWRADTDCDWPSSQHLRHP